MRKRLVFIAVSVARFDLGWLYYQTLPEKIDYEVNIFGEQPGVDYEQKDLTPSGDLPVYAKGTWSKAPKYDGVCEQRYRLLATATFGDFLGAQRLIDTGKTPIFVIYSDFDPKWFGSSITPNLVRIYSKNRPCRWWKE